MDTEKAFKVIEDVCAYFNGNLTQHNLIQTALRQIKTLQPKPQPLTAKKDPE